MKSAAKLTRRNGNLRFLKTLPRFYQNVDLTSMCWAGCESQLAQPQKRKSVKERGPRERKLWQIVATLNSKSAQQLARCTLKREIMLQNRILPRIIQTWDTLQLENCIEKDKGHFTVAIGAESANGHWNIKWAI